MTHRLYVAGCSMEDDGGVYTLEFSPGEGTIKTTDFAALPGAGYLVFSADRTRLYVASLKSARFPDDGEVAAFAVAPDGGLTWINSLPAGGLANCHVVIGGRHLYCANYSSGTVGEFLIGRDGGLERCSQRILHEGRSVHPTRQTCAHPHCVRVTPDGRFLVVVDLGCDGLYLYPLDPDAGLTPTPCRFIRAQPGEGPRHILFNAAGTAAYVVNELGNSVSVFGYARGEFTFRQSLSTLPEGYAGPSTGAAIRLTTDGTRLLVSNRGHDSITIFDVMRDGQLRFANTVPVHGAWPRDFILFDGGAYAAIANERSDSVVILACDNGAAASFRRVGAASVPQPVCVLENLP